MLRTPMCAKHLAAVARTLQWADECADRVDLLDVIAWLGTLEAIVETKAPVFPGSTRSEAIPRLAELARTRAKAAAAGQEQARGEKRCSRRGARRRRWIHGGNSTSHARPLALFLGSGGNPQDKESMINVSVAGATGAIGRQLWPRLVALRVTKTHGPTVSASKQAEALGMRHFERAFALTLICSRTDRRDESGADGSGKTVPSRS